MYNFNISNDTYNAVLTWLEVLSEFDYSYEKIRLGEIKTRRLQQKALRKEEYNKQNLEPSYMNIDSLPKKDNLLFELLITHDNEKDENIGLDYLSETINYFVGEDNDNSINFLK